MKPTEQIFLPCKRWYCHRGIEKWLLLSTDGVAATCAMALSVFILRAISDEFAAAQWTAKSQMGLVRASIVLVGMMLALMWSKGHYTRRQPVADDIKDVVTLCAGLALTNAALLFLGKHQVSRGLVLLNWTMMPACVLLLRWFVKRALIASGGWVRPMVIIGYGDNAVETALAFQDEPMMGLRLVAFLVPVGQEPIAAQVRDRTGNVVPSLSLGHDPSHMLEQLGYPHVVLALEQGGIDTHQELIFNLHRRNQEIQVVPAVRGLALYGMEVNHFFAHEVLLLTMRNNLARRLPQLIKRCFDLVVSACVLVVGAPLFLFIAARVASSKGPIFFGHTRVGQNNKPFKCYKFRTMAPNADKLLNDLLENDPAAREEWERDFKLKNDPRITSIGHFLRKTSLDEIPQLWNVLKGEMSLVGPRPVVTAELERYGTQVDFYLEAKPGITGLWQVSGRNDVSYDTRVYLDAWYVKNWSLFNDIMILLRTVKVIFRRDGAY